MLWEVRCVDELIQTLEKERRRALLPFWVLLALVLLTLPLFVYMFSVWLIATAIFFSVYAFISSKFKKRYMRLYKKLAVCPCLDETYDDVRYEQKRGFDQEYIDSLCCMQKGSQFESEDWYSASYNGVRFECADVCIANTASSNGSPQTTVYFRGKWIVFDFDKHFKRCLQVRQKGFLYANKSGGRLSNDAEIKKFSVKNEIFNRNFAVYAADEEDVYSILTPSVTDAMCRLKDRTNGKIMLCFTDNKLHVAYNDNGDSFEPPVFSRITRESLVKNILGETLEIAEFADTLKMEKKIWAVSGTSL